MAGYSYSYSENIIAICFYMSHITIQSIATICIKLLKFQLVDVLYQFANMIITPIV